MGTYFTLLKKTGSHISTHNIISQSEDLHLLGCKMIPLSESVVFQQPTPRWVYPFLIVFFIYAVSKNLKEQKEPLQVCLLFTVVCVCAFTAGHFPVSRLLLKMFCFPLSGCSAWLPHSLVKSVVMVYTLSVCERERDVQYIYVFFFCSGWCWTIIWLKEYEVNQKESRQIHERSTGATIKVKVAISKDESEVVQKGKPRAGKFLNEDEWSCVASTRRLLLKSKPYKLKRRNRGCKDMIGSLLQNMSHCYSKWIQGREIRGGGSVRKTRRDDKRCKMRARRRDDRLRAF